MTRSAVLILARDPVVGALLGASVELAGRQPFFPAPNEEPAAAANRVAPDVILLDVGHSAEEAIASKLLSAGARVILFGPQETEQLLSARAARAGTRSFTIPVDGARLAQLLTTSE